MISLLLAASIQMTADIGDPENIYRANLSASARQELELVERVRSLRASVEKLPDTWKGSRLGAQPDGGVLTKQSLLHEIENMEFSAAERWSVILNNTAYLDRITDPKAFAARKELLDVPKAQFELRKRIEEVNSKLRDETLSNLASKVMLN